MFPPSLISVGLSKTPVTFTGYLYESFAPCRPLPGLHRDPASPPEHIVSVNALHRLHLQNFLLMTAA